MLCRNCDGNEFTEIYLDYQYQRKCSYCGTSYNQREFAQLKNNIQFITEEVQIDPTVKEKQGNSTKQYLGMWLLINFVITPLLVIFFLPLGIISAIFALVFFILMCNSLANRS